MLINENKGIRLFRSILYYLIIGIWLTMDLLLYMGFDIGNYLTDSLYYSILRPLRYLSYLFCIFLQTYHKRELLAVLPISLILFVSGRLSGSNTLFYLWLFVLMAKEIDFRGVALEATLLLTVGTAVFALLVLTGVIPEYCTGRSNGTICHGLGYCHPNCLSQAIAILALGYGCVRRSTFKLWDYLLLVGLIVFIWLVPNSRTAAACLLLYIVLRAFEPLFSGLAEAARGRVSAFLAVLFFCGAAAIVLLCVFYDPALSWMQKLDTVLSCRLSYCKAALDEFGVSLIGQQVYLTPSERTYAGLADLEERIVDVAYVHILLRNGLIPMLLLMAGFTLSIWYAGRKGNYPVMTMLFTAGVFGTSENLYRNTAFCFFVIAFSGVLFRKGQNIETGSRTVPRSGNDRITKDRTAPATEKELYLPDIRQWLGPLLDPSGKGNVLPALLFSLIFGFCAALGRNIYRFDSFSIDFKHFIFYTALSVAGLSVMIVFTGKLRSNGVSDSRSLPKLWFRFFVPVLLLYVLCFLAYYPGVGMNDGLNILFEGVTTSRYMPSLYVAFVVLLGKIGTRLGGIRYAVVLYSVIQLLLSAAFSAAFLVWVYRKKLPRLVKVLLWVWFVCSPLLALYAISMVKDTVFSLALTAVCLALSDAANDHACMKHRLFWPVFLLLCIIMIAFRNNGLYIVLALSIVLFFLFRKHRKGILALILAALLTLGASKAVQTAFHSRQLFQESAAIPLQQICRVIAEDGEINEEQLAFMDELLSVETIRENYDPYCADYIKWDLEFDHDLLNERKTEFLRLWWELLPKNFGLYIKAWLQETFWFWAPVQGGELQVFYTIEGAGNDKPLQQFCLDNGIVHSSLLPAALFVLLNRFYTFSSLFLREGVCFWIFAALALIRLLQTRNLRSLLSYLPVFLLWGTIMISAPISDSFRYVLVYAYMLPLYAAELFSPSDSHIMDQ